MQQNFYYKTVLRRENHFKAFLLDTFLAAASLPRLVLEVFIRKNFGERYFSRAAALTVAFLFALYPVVTYKMLSLGQRYLSISANFSDEPIITEQIDTAYFWKHAGTCYLFLIAFLVVCWKRSREIERNPSTYDFAKFSLYSGDIHPMFFDIPERFGLKATIRRVEVLYEPLFFFAVGFALSLMGQWVGGMLEWCALFYGMGYVAQYWKARNYLMDLIDDFLMREQLINGFVKNLPPSQTKWVRFHAIRPSDEGLRQRLADKMQSSASHEPLSSS